MTDVEAMVCIAHGRFIPCRKEGQHRLTSDPYWVKSVTDYQLGEGPNMTWVPAWHHPVWVVTDEGLSVERGEQ